MGRYKKQNQVLVLESSATTTFWNLHICIRSCVLVYTCTSWYISPLCVSVCVCVCVCVCVRVCAGFFKPSFDPFSGTCRHDTPITIKGAPACLAFRCN